MKRIGQLCTILVAMLISSVTQGQVANKWVRSIPNSEGRTLALDLSGNVYVAGIAANDIKTIKYDSLGNEIWTHTYSGFGSGTDLPSKILVDNSGNVYVGGIASAMSGELCVLYKLDPAGNLLWQDTMNTDPAGAVLNFVSDMAFDNSGNIVLCGNIQSPDGTMGYPTLLVSKHDVNGNELWRDITGVGFAYNYFYNLAIDANGNIYSVGNEYSGTPPSNQFIVRKNDASGVIAWQDVYNEDPTAAVGEVAIDVQLDAAGDVYVAGYTGQGGRDLLIRKYDPSGASLWTQTFSTVAGANWDETKKLAVTSNGDAYILGRTAPGNQADGQVLLVKYDANGNLAWSQVYTYGINEDAFDIAVDEAAGTVVVVCYSRRTSFYVDIVTLKYDFAGNLIWEKRQPSPGQSTPAAVMIGANRNVYVTGTESGTFTTIRMMDADASVMQNVTTAGNYNFNNTNDTTAVSVDFATVDVPANAVVSFLANAPANFSWCTGTDSPAFISDYRWAVTAMLLDFSTALFSISLTDLAAILPNGHGMVNPANFSIYQRPLDGKGEFCKLVTTFANMALTAEVSSFSEFFIGSETDSFSSTSLAKTELVASGLRIYPNPASDETLLDFDVKERTAFRIIICDLQGRLVKEVHSGMLTSGNHRIKLNVDDLSSGLYMCRLSTIEGSITTKLTVIH